MTDCAIRRLHALREVVQGDEAPALNADRAALLGNALKRKAAVLVEQRKAWSAVSKVLAEAAEAYRSGVADPTPDVEPGTDEAGRILVA